MNIVKLKVGDIVILRNNLRHGERYGGIHFITYMDELLDKHLTIKRFYEGNYKKSKQLPFRVFEFNSYGMWITLEMVQQVIRR